MFFIYLNLFFPKQQFFDKFDKIPLDAIHYLTAECNYGGRITDEFDRRLINVLLKTYLLENYFQDSIYFTNNFCNYESILEFINNLPIISIPEDFGLQSNAGISKNYHESESLLNRILFTLPRQVIVLKKVFNKFKLIFS